MRQECWYKIVLTLMLIFSLFPIQLIGAETVSSVKAIEDAEYLREKLETVHPNLYFETPKEVAESDFEDIIETLEGQAIWSKLELYRLFSPFVSSFKDGHTFLSISQEFQKYSERAGRVIPLMVNVENGKLVVGANLLDRNPSPGKEIISVNGKDAGEIYHSMTNLIGAGQQSFVEEKATRNFPVYLWALYDFSGPFEVSYQAETGERKTRILRGISISEYREREDAKLGKNELNWDLSFPRSDVGLLTINTFARNLEGEFKEFVEDSFREISERNADYLIIDLTENGGGSTKLSNYLYQFVSDEPFRTFAEVRVKYSDPVLERKTLYNPITWFKVKVLGDKTIIHKNNYKKPPGTKFRFDGDLYLFTGPMTFSTAANFAALIKDTGVGTIVGEETGGLASSYGDIFKLKLPNSGLNFGVSYKHFLGPSGSDDGRGVLPDISLSTDPIGRYRFDDSLFNELLEK